MGFLTDRRILVTGVLSNRSIAYGVARACAARRRERSRSPTSTTTSRIAWSSSPATSARRRCCAATSARDDDIDALFASLRVGVGRLDGLLHSIAFAPREALAGDFLNGMSRTAFATAHDISSYSLAALAKGARPLMQGRDGVASSRSPISARCARSPTTT